MATTTKSLARTPLVLRADTAADMMSPNPISLEDAALVSEAIMLLTERGFSAAPVIDEAGRPIGVVSRTDLLIHDREQGGCLTPADWYEEAEVASDYSETERLSVQVKRVDTTTVRDVMTPVVFSVTPETPAEKVVEQMLALNVHRLFVVDADGILVGVISVLDILKFLRR